MPITVISGGQFGSEGKGKVSHYWSSKKSAAAVVRVGGPNSGHTVVENGRTYKLQILPTGAILDDTDVILPAGSYIPLDLLFKEMAITCLSPDRLYIHPNAMIVTESLENQEKSNSALDDIGSTKSGTGAAVIARIERERPLLSRDVPELKNFVCDTSALLRSYLNRGARIVIEGTQGFGLSLYHSPYYPYATSRDTTAAGTLSEVGLSPMDVDEVVLVLRAFPIRVAGVSGPLPKEISWEEVSRIAGNSRSISEFTTVTKKLRRVANFDSHIPNLAIAANRPTHVVMNHVDYFDENCYETDVLTPRALRNLNIIAQELAAPISHIGLGPTSVIESVKGE